MNITITSSDLVLRPGPGTGPHIVRFAYWLLGQQPPNLNPGSPLGPGGRWKKFVKLVKALPANTMALATKLLNRGAKK